MVRRRDLVGLSGQLLLVLLLVLLLLVLLLLVLLLLLLMLDLGESVCRACSWGGRVRCCKFVN